MASTLRIVFHMDPRAMWKLLLGLAHAWPDSVLKIPIETKDPFAHFLNK